MKKISIVVPCYNEEDVLKMFYTELMKVIKMVEKDYEYEIICVDDGSKDKTLTVLKDLRQEDKNVRIISFSRNFGKEAAMYAGLSNSEGDLVVLIDADLQHPPETILTMLQEINNGYDMVATKRKNRKRRVICKKCFFKIILQHYEEIYANGTRGSRF